MYLLENDIHKRVLGQYFTISPSLQAIVHSYVRNRGELLLEPSFGAGHLLRPFLAANAAYPMMCYEIDARVKPVVSFGAAQQVIYGDFLAALPDPREGVAVDLDVVIAHLNSEECKKNYMYAGRFKMGQRQLCCMMI